MWRPRLARLSNYRRVIRLLCQVKACMSSSVIALVLSLKKQKKQHKCFAKETCIHWEELSSYLLSERARRVILVDKICLLQLKQVIKSL